MLVVGLKDIKKHYGARLLLDIESLNIFEGDKIGIVGVNGVGKTTLLEIINGSVSYDSGELNVSKNSIIKYVSQLDSSEHNTLSGRYASIFQVDHMWSDSMSGGEKTRFKLAEAFESRSNTLLIDEPTNNLDIDGIELITKNFQAYKGTLLVVSHDRSFLDSVCNKILEIENGKCKLYNGNYSKYLELKESEDRRSQFEYDAFIKEKERLVKLKSNIERQSAKVKTTPKRMGNSEARLHKMGGQGNKAKLDRFAKSVEKRMEHLDKKDRPVEQDVIKISISESSKPHSKVLISGHGINKAFGDQVIFEEAILSVSNGKKTALLGSNGSGKTTLINMILNKENIDVSKNVRIGYFSQSLDTLDEEKTILENVLENSIHEERLARLILARLLIKGDKVFEKLKILSGGERVKVSFAKIILEDINMLILDEPTNYLDLNSLSVIEELLVNYNGSILLVSHDRQLINNVCDELLIIEDKKIVSYKGTYAEYSSNVVKREINTGSNDMQRMVLENQISSLLGKISVENNDQLKAEYEDQYRLKVEALKSLSKS